MFEGAGESRGGSPSLAVKTFLRPLLQVLRKWVWDRTSLTKGLSPAAEPNLRSACLYSQPFPRLSGHSGPETRRPASRQLAGAPHPAWLRWAGCRGRDSWNEKMLRDYDPRLRERREKCLGTFFIRSDLTFDAEECVIITDPFQRSWVLVQGFGAVQESEEAPSPSQPALGPLSTASLTVSVTRVESRAPTTWKLQLPDSPGKPRTQNRAGGENPNRRSVYALGSRASSSFHGGRGRRPAGRGGLCLRWFYCRTMSPKLGDHLVLTLKQTDNGFSLPASRSN